MQNKLLRIISFYLAILMLTQYAFAVDSTEEAAKTFENKTISILGDSISTYEGISSGVAAQTTNSTIKNNRVYYKNSRFEVTLNDTWWMQAKEVIGAEILVNNSYSGSTIFSPFGDNESLGYFSRPYNLHDNTGDNAGQEPDIIAVFMGTNDLSYHKTRLGSYAEINFSQLITKSDGSFNYKAPTTSAEAYAIMLHKIITTYENAEVYCFTILPRSLESAGDINLLKNFNDTIKNIANHYGCFVVDVYNNTGITHEKENTNRYLLEGYLHPNNRGMDAITGAFLSSLYENSRYVPENTVLHDVTYQLEDVIINEGTVAKAIENNSFECNLTKLIYGNLNVIVKMNSEDITDQCYADGKIMIPQVTGSIEITADVTQEPRTFKSYRFENSDGMLRSISKNENCENALTEEAAIYTLENNITLCYDTPWTAVFKSNNIEAERINVLSSQTESGASLVFDKSKNILGISFNNNPDNIYGIDVSPIDQTLSHSFKITNEHFIDGSNSFTLYVDNKLFGTFNSHFVNGEYADSNISPLYEKDFIFDNISKEAATNIEYIQIWENETKIGHQHFFYNPEEILPTCTEYGATVSCCDCGAVNSVPDTPPTGHTESNTWLMSRPATVAEAGEAYKQCTVCEEVTQTKAIPQLRCAKPVISSLTNTEDGIKISWKPVAGADSYRVYHRLINSSWRYLGTVSNTSFIDTDSKNGYWYNYTVIAVNEAGCSDFCTTGNMIQALNTPKFKSAQNTHQGIRLTWNKIAGAKGYYIYKKAGNGNWQYYCCTSDTSYTDKNVSNGIIYSYRIKAFRNKTVSGFYYNGITIKRFASPVMLTPVNTNSGIKVQWNKLSGAAGYYVYRKVKGSSWTCIGKTTNTYFIDTKAEAGKTYIYTVKAYNSVGQLSAYNTTGKSYKRLTTPNVYDTDKVYNGIKIQWKTVSGAGGYYVYRKTADSSWKYLGKTTSKSFTDKTAEKGVTYTYTVKAYSGSSVSTYSAKGINAKR